jgi:hypothetical protein
MRGEDLGRPLERAADQLGEIDDTDLRLDRA